MIREITEERDLPFDLVDDTSVFMRNDPQFYRKEYFPTISKVADLHRAGKIKNAKNTLKPMIDKGITSYCAKYNLAKTPEEVFKQEDRDALLDKLFSEEMDQIKNGDYK